MSFFTEIRDSETLSQQLMLEPFRIQVMDGGKERDMTISVSMDGGAAGKRAGRDWEMDADLVFEARWGKTSGGAVMATFTSKVHFATNDTVSINGQTLTGHSGTVPGEDLVFVGRGVLNSTSPDERVRRVVGRKIAFEMRVRGAVPT